jgi:cytochrome c peroxidase
MTITSPPIPLAVLVLLLTAASAVAAPPQGAGTFTYVGAARCRLCHSTERIGGQYHIWAESKHAKAFETLGSEKARAMAKKRGIAYPQKAPECLACHVTGQGEPAERFSPSYSAAEGVSCEGCHGAGSGFAKISTMQGIRQGTLRAGDFGLTLGDKTVCARCHNQKPDSGGFVDWPRDSAAIAHPIPPGYKSGEQTSP